MLKKKRILLFSVLVLANLSTPFTWAERQDLKLEQIKLPAGFHITVFAESVPNARGLAHDCDSYA